MKRIIRISTGLSLILAHLMATSGQLRAQTPKVHVVLFFSPTCPHCHEVIQNHLPIFFDIYGGTPQMWTDPSEPDTDRSLYLIFNDELEILLVDATGSAGGRLFVADLESHGIPPEQGSVPRMVFGEDVLIGDVQIPSRFHPLMREALAQGGLDWPAIPGLAEMTAAFPTATALAADSETVARVGVADSMPEVATDSVAARGDTLEPDATAADEAHPPGATDTGAVRSAHGQPGNTAPDGGAAVITGPEATVPAAEDTITGSDSAAAVGSEVEPGDRVAPSPDPTDNPYAAVPQRQSTVMEKLQRDPIGNGIAVIVLLAMIASIVVIAGSDRLQGPGTTPSAAIVVVAVLGIAVASYLSYVETSGATAVCGPVGDCNTVQQSRYAMLLGVPVGTLGLLAYIAIIAAWFIARSGSQPASDFARFSLLAIAFAGTLFSIYLTFLEPFVIGATCAWCLASSVAITVLLWLSASSGKAALARLWGRQESS